MSVYKILRGSKRRLTEVELRVQVSAWVNSSTGGEHESAGSSVVALDSGRRDSDSSGEGDEDSRELELHVEVAWFAWFVNRTVGCYETLRASYAGLYTFSERIFEAEEPSHLLVSVY